MALFMVGLSHQTASVDLRENFLREAPTPERLLATGACREAILLSTCNRHEIYLDAEVPFEVPAGISVLDEGDAVRHLFSVASSLESLVLGENQILGQIKAAEETAIREKTAGPVLRRLFVEARRTGARVRTRTGLGAGNISVASVAARLAEKIFGGLRERVVFLIGIGEMGRLLAEHFSSAGARLKASGSRSDERLEAFCAMAGAEKVERGKAAMLEAISGSDVIVTATSADRGYVLDADALRRLMSVRKGRPLFVIDIGVPRNIDPKAGDLRDLYLYDMDDLETVAREHRARRQDEVLAAAAIVDEAAAGWKRIRREIAVRPLLASAYGKLKRMEEELNLDEETRRGVRLRRRRFFHFAHRALLEGDEIEAALRVEGFVRLFGIQK